MYMVLHAATPSSQYKLSPCERDGAQAFLTSNGAHGTGK